MWGTVRNAVIIFVSVMVLGLALVVVVYGFIQLVDALAAELHQSQN